MTENNKVFGQKFLGLINLFISKFWDITKINLFSVVFYIPSFIILFFLLVIAVPADLEGLASVMIYSLEDVVMLDLLVRMAFGLILVSIPIVVFGPAVAGAANVFKNLITRQPANTWSVFLQTIKKHFIKSFLISAISTIVIFLSMMSLRLWIQLAGKIDEINDGFMKFLLDSKFIYGLILFVIVLFILVFIMMHLYIYQLLVQYDLPITKLYKYSYTFALLRFIPNLLIIITCIVITILPFWIHYLLGGGMIFIITFGLCGLIINYFTWPALAKHFEPLTKK